MPTPISFLLGIVGIAAVCTLIERLSGSRHRPPPLTPQQIRRSRRIDLAWLLLGSLLTRGTTQLLLACLLVGLLVAQDLPRDPETVAWLLAGHGPVATWPLWLHGLVALLLVDLTGYLLHRLLHGQSWLWRVHAVHHSSRRLDWLASVRGHPLNPAFARTAQLSVLLLFGFSPLVLAGLGPFLILYGLFLHANVPWRFGLLRFVIATPLFHRWHHAEEYRGTGMNFAGLFPVWDILGGTYYCPAHMPERCGIDGDPVPEALGGQLLYPFRR